MDDVIPDYTEWLPALTTNAFDVMWHRVHESHENQPPFIACGSRGANTMQRQDAVNQGNNELGQPYMYPFNSPQLHWLNSAIGRLPHATVELSLLWRAGPHSPENRRFIAQHDQGDVVINISGINQVDTGEIWNGRVSIGYCRRDHSLECLLSILPSYPPNGIRRFGSMRSYQIRRDTIIGLRDEPENITPETESASYKIEQYLLRRNERPDAAQFFAHMAADQPYAWGNVSIAVRSGSQRRYGATITISDRKAGRFTTVNDGNFVTARPVTSADLINEVNTAYVRLMADPRR